MNNIGQSKYATQVRVRVLFRDKLATGAWATGRTAPAAAGRCVPTWQFHEKKLNRLPVLPEDWGH